MKLAAALLTVCALASIAAGRAEAGYGVAPNGQSFTVTTTSAGTIADPATFDLVVYLDGQDSDATVWVSESQQIGPSGAPAGGSVGSCTQAALLPFGEPGKWVCRVSTSLMRPGRTYYWWLDFRRLEAGADSTPFPGTFTPGRQPSRGPKRRVGRVPGDLGAGSARLGRRQRWRRDCTTWNRFAT
jgi:hypothetical protein